MKAAGQNTVGLESRLNMFGGILLWRAAQEYPARVAVQQAELKEIDHTLENIAQTRAHIEDITATSMDIQPILARLHVLQEEVERKLKNTDALLESQTKILRTQVDQQLAAHEKRLNNYLAQAHLAVARLYDAELRMQPE
jgi:paraquat-inducible protein B